MYVNIRIHEKTSIYIYMSSDVEVKYISSLIFCVSKDVRVKDYCRFTFLKDRDSGSSGGTGGNPESHQFPLVPMVMQNNPANFPKQMRTNNRLLYFQLGF